MDVLPPLPSWLHPATAIAGVGLLAILRYRHCERRGRGSWAAISVPMAPVSPYRETSLTALTRAPLRTRVEAFTIIALGALWPLAFLDALICSANQHGARWVFDAIVVVVAGLFWARGRTVLFAPKRSPLALVLLRPLLLASLLTFVVFKPMGVGDAKRASTRVSAKVLRVVATVFRAENPNEPCPTAQVLRDRRYIDAASKLTDAWDRPFFIDCTEDDVRISSAGRDQKLGSPDDVVEPLAARFADSGR